MHPVLLELDGWPAVNAYGTLILLGGLVAMPCVLWDMRRRGLAPGRTHSMLVDLYLVLVFGAALGGRLFHVVTAPRSYIEDPARILAADGTGFVFFGSLTAIAAGMVWLAKRYDANVASVVDAVATWVPLTHLLGRLGCWFAGCCWGAPSDAAWAVSLPEPSVAYQLGEVARDGARTVALHPTQLMESSGLAVSFLILLAFRIRRGIEAPWRQASRYALCYGIVRALTEVFRGDASRGFLLQWPLPSLSTALGLAPDHPIALSFSQATALGLAALGAWGLRRTRS